MFHKKSGNTFRKKNKVKIYQWSLTKIRGPSGNEARKTKEEQEQEEDQWHIRCILNLY